MSPKNKDRDKPYKFATVLLTCIVLGVAIWTLILTKCQYDLQTSPDLHLDFQELCSFEDMFLLLVNTGNAPANQVKVSMYMPKNFRFKGCEAMFSEIKRDGDSLIVLDYKERIIYPVYKSQTRYTIAFYNINRKSLKQSNIPLKYRIECNNMDPVERTIPISDILRMLK